MPNIEKNSAQEEAKYSNSSNEEGINRREFLKLAGATLAGTVVALTTPKKIVASESTDPRDITFLESGPDEITALGAVVAAVKEFNKQPYTWDSAKLHCSGFVGEYMRHLGFEVSRDDTDPGLYKADSTEPMPEATTVKQAQYLHELNKSLGGDLIAEVPLKKMLTDRELWQQVPPGTVMYLPEPEGHHGYDTYTHTTVFIGLDSDKKPRFAEFSGYMSNGPEYGHGFSQFASLYRKKSIEPKLSSNKELKVLMFDAVEASRRFDLEHGVVTPDTELFSKLGYDNVISININDGRLSMWEITEDGAKKQKIGEREEMFTVVGRKLKRNKYLSNEYWEKMSDSNPSTIYDSGSGCHIDKEGIRRTTYTPPLISELAQTEVLANFGGLGAQTHTDICLLRQIYFGRNNSKILSNKFSPYTLHEVPRNTGDQEILLREPALEIANTRGRPVELPNLSSGCINLDGDSWGILKKEIKRLQESGKKISVMFSTPRINQKDIIKPGDENSWFYENDPFGGEVNKWGYSETEGIGHNNWIYYKRNKEYPLFKERVINVKETFEPSSRRDPLPKME
jgi:hypothetical protein